MKYFALIFLLLMVAACNTNEDPAFQENKASVSRLEKLVKEYPDSVGLKLSLLNYYDSIGLAAKAYPVLNELIANDSANYGLWFRRGQLEEVLEDTAAAINSYLRAINIYPGPEAQLSLAYLLAEKKDSKSMVICKRILELGLGRETEASCYFIQGVYYARIADFDKAETLFDQTIAASYTYMEAYIEKGLLFFDRGRYREALQVFTFASTINNLYADAYYYMARCYEMMQMKDSATIRFEQSLSLDKNMVEAKAGLERVRKM